MGSIRAIVALGLVAAVAACGADEQAPSTEASTAARPAATASAAAAGACKPGETRLPGARLCESAALALMPVPDAVDEPGCRWVLAETGLPDDEWVVYRALACKAGTTRLEYGGGAQMAQLTLAESAFGAPVSPDPEPYAVVSLIAAAPDARTAIRGFARYAIEDRTEAAGCDVRLAKVTGWPGDALVVDVSATEAAKAPADEIRSACGPYGYTDDATMFWRPSGRYALWFNLGQDIPEVDAGSFVVVKDGAISF